MDVAGNELGEGVRDRDDGFAEIGVGDARGTPERAGPANAGN